MLHPVPHEYGHEPPIVELKEVSCGYDGRAALREVSLSVMPGDFVGLLGPSGSGKTTLLRSIVGAVDLYHGDVVVEGESVAKRRPRTGYVPQLGTIDWNFPVTVWEVVMMGCTSGNPLFPWYGRSERERGRRILERLGIADLARRHIRDLSGGEQQRTFLARALVSNPRLLVLDEPTSGVDIKTRDDVMHLLETSQLDYAAGDVMHLLDDLNHQDITIIMSTHEINAVAAHLPRVVCLNGGVIADGPPGEVFTSDVLSRTYGAEMPITQYQGITLVAETPHHFGRGVHPAGGRQRAGE